MAVYNDYPYSNMHEINLDWIIEKVVNAELEINDAIDKINQALDKFQELNDKVDGMEDLVNQAVIDSRSALEKANDALSSLQSTREEIAVLARLVDMTSDKADRAINTANSAEEKANQVMEDLRDVVEVQIPIISRVATNAMDTATQAEAKADEAINKMFIAEYGITTYNELQQAILSKKIIYVDQLDGALMICSNGRAYTNKIGLIGFNINTNPPEFDVARVMFYTIDKNDNWTHEDIFMQERLVGRGIGQNIKTINNQNILGTGNIDIPTSSLPELELGTSVQIGTYKEGANKYKVFQKVIDLGSLPDSGSKTVAHGIDKTKVLKYLSIQGTASQANFGNTLPLPCVTLGSESVNNNIYVSVGGNNITIATGRDRTAYTGTLTITYVDNEPLP